MEHEKRCVYVVTRGCYSDYSIWRVFSSKENAEDFLSGLSGELKEEEDIDIEEYVLDDFLKNPFSGLTASIGLIEGVCAFYPSMFTLEKTVDEFYDQPGPSYTVMDSRINLQISDYDCNPSIVMNFDHTDKMSAAKVMSEKRAQLIATHGMEYLLKHPGYYHRDTLEHCER